MNSAKAENSLFDLIKPGVILLLITAVSALLLGFVNGLTAERIEKNNQEKVALARDAVMPEAGLSFTETDFVPEGIVSGIVRAEKDGQLIGYCIESNPQGFGGAVQLIVGISPEKTVTGVYIVAHTETAGLGSKAREPSFLEQYNGKGGVIELKGSNAIDTISGATVTSKAVTDGVNEALAAAEKFVDGEGA